MGTPYRTFLAGIEKPDLVEPRREAWIGPPKRSAPPEPPSLEEVRHLVLEALNLGEHGAPTELSRDQCGAWDSLGQVAIASALFDRYGIEVDGDLMFQLGNLQDIYSCVASKLAKTRTAELQASVSPELPSFGEDPEMLPLLDAAEATRLLAAQFPSQAFSSERSERIGVAIAATFTAQPLASPIQVWGRAFGFHLDCRFADFNQLAQTLLDPHSVFARNVGGVNVLLLRPEDLPASFEDAASELDHLANALRQLAGANSGSQYFAATLPPVVSSFASMDRLQVDLLRQRWRAALEAIDGVTIVDFGGLVERLGTERARSSQGEALARSPYSPVTYQELGIAVVRHIRASRRSAAKVIVLDCDNTLWGGVVGEAGIDGIELSSDGRGRSFQLFQRYVKRLQSRGILLAVASRNELRDVRDVFENHPEMVLRADDISAWRINWNHKSQSLAELADELQLGLDSFVFLDDDPAIRAEVKTRQPSVHVVPLPPDPALWRDALERLWLFDGAGASAEDSARTRMTQEENLRKMEQKSAATLEEFFAGLDLRVEIRSPLDGEWPRVAQLAQRTNQFNLSLKRRTVDELKALALHSDVLVLRAGDRFGDYGLVGLCILTPTPRRDLWEVDTFLLSCRALGRGIEDAFLHGAAATASERGARSLLATYVEGPRNQQVKAFLERSGFRPKQQLDWECSVAQLPPLPSHVRLEVLGSSVQTN
jgi:FkbH-like protein